MIKWLRCAGRIAGRAQISETVGQLSALADAGETLLLRPINRI